MSNLGSDLGNVLSLWRAARESGGDYVLATVVELEGSSYRKPGARMLLTASGRRAGTISGGCLEAEVSRKAWWLTEGGPVVERYSTFFDADGDIPYGLGCGGTVSVLLERKATAEPVLALLADAYERRLPCWLATVIAGEGVGRRWFPGVADRALAELAAEAEATQSSLWRELPLAGAGGARVFAEYVPARLGIFIFGAGDDAQPLAEMAVTMGWETVVADGRAHLATRERFPAVHRVTTLQTGGVAGLGLRPTDAAVLVTHSYEQDRQLLKELLPLPLRYLAMLGPRKRTLHLLEAVAPEIGMTPAACLLRVKSPAGLDIGADTPAGIALSIAAEMEAALHQPLRVRDDAAARVEDRSSLPRAG